MSTSNVIVITGASAGIGAALATTLGSQGHRIVLAARREAELEKVAERTGSDALVVVADVRRRADVDRLRDRALERFGHVDVWVNNAGRGIGKTVMELTDEDFDEMMAVNTKSALYGMQAIVPHFIERGQGHVINVSSMLSRVPFVSFRSAYNAAKAALNMLSANLRMDLQAYPGIHVTVVMPGVVTTEFRTNALSGTPPFRGSAMLKPQSAEDVASAIAGAMAHPVAEIYTNPEHADVARRYYADVAAFEEGLRRQQGSA